MSDLLVTVEQAAEQLKLHPKTVLRHIREGRLPATRIGKSWRIQQAELDAYAGIATGRANDADDLRATCVVEFPGVSPEKAQRIATSLSAVGMAGQARTSPIRITTAFDPLAKHLKVVVIGSPVDAAKVLEMLAMVANA
jgi:excisionase family DNA binding protein